MSQKKVEAYKEYKKNKKEVIKKEKTMRRLRTALVSLAAVILIGWFGWSIYHKATYVEPDGSATTVNFSNFDEYYNDLPEQYTADNEAE